MQEEIKKIEGEMTLKKIWEEKTKQILEEKNLVNRHNLKIPKKKLIFDENLAYILGVIEGDGCIGWDTKKMDYNIRLGVKDKDFALAFKKALEKWSSFDVNMKFYKIVWVVTLSSKVVANSLKTFNLDEIKTSPNKIKKMFLKGMYDSEGCVGFGNKSLTLSNNNKYLLQFCKDLLSDLGIESKPIRIGKKKGSIYKAPGRNGTSNFNNYGFGIYGKEKFIKFRNSVGFNIKRKQDKLIEMINSYLTKEQNKFQKSLPNHKRKNWGELYKVKV